jgi:hypothetical protein
MMLKKIYHFFAKYKGQRSDFSSFFRHASPSEKKKLIERVAREANQEQREMMERYKKAQQGAL